MRKAIIISLKFHPGHVSHLVASYKQCQELGYETFYYVNEAFVRFLPEDSHIIIFGKEKSRDVDLAVFTFPNIHNLQLMLYLRRKYKPKIVYVFHEPLTKLSVYRKAGFSTLNLIKLALSQVYDFSMLSVTDSVILPSTKALTYYRENKLCRNRNYHYLPLMYDDERGKRHTMMSRLYFGYIGTVASDHSFEEYLRFVEWAISNNHLEGINFLIATKSEFEAPEMLTSSNRVIIKKGTPLTDEEINAYYASTIVVWNAYARTTQSGVLAKSFMFGTPAIVMRKNLNEFTHDGENVVAIDDNTNFEEIEAAVKKIHDNFYAFSSASRKEFEKSFYYRVYNERFREIIDGKSQRK